MIHTSIVMVRCLATGRELSTGVEMDAATFERLPDIRSRIKCPVCNLDHDWSTRDAWLGNPAPSAPQQYLAPKGIPPPTREQFQLLLEHRPKRLSFLQVLANTARYILRHPLDLYTDLIGRPRVWTNEEIFGYEPVNFRTHADYFLQVIGKFQEVRQKTVFVIAGAGISGEFAPALLARTNRPTNVIPIEVDVGANFYTLDMHPNKFGHQKIAAQIIEKMKKSIEGRNCLGL